MNPFFSIQRRKIFDSMFGVRVCVLFLKRTIIILSKKIRRKNDDDGFQKKIWSIHFSPSHSIHDSLLLFFNLKFNLLEKERERTKLVHGMKSMKCYDSFFDGSTVFSVCLIILTNLIWRIREPKDKVKKKKLSTISNQNHREEWKKCPNWIKSMMANNF